MEVFVISTVKGYVHSIETFGTVDGPGIRCVVFFQGCPLRCLYCHNSDTRRMDMASKMYEAKELAEEVARYKHFFDTSNGGVTASGGEPTLQAEFLGDFFRECKKRGIQTALDTSGYVDMEAAKKFLDFTDLVLLDVKHLDEEKCIELTGKSNEKFFKFLGLLEQKNIPVIIRQVLVEGFTDSAEYIDSLITFLNQYSCIKKVEVLPFHKMGEHKWETLGLKAPLAHLSSYSEEKAQSIQKLINESMLYNSTKVQNIVY